MATGGKSQLNDRLQVLKGRKIVAFPDVDGYQEWKEKLSHVDIADLLVRQYRREHISITPFEEQRDPMIHPTYLKLKELVNIRNMV